jgi:thymidine phosphorylase
MSFSPAWIIQKKRDGEPLSADEIQEFVRGITDGSIADYQASAFLMATFFTGMNADETVALTRVLRREGRGRPHGPRPGGLRGALVVDRG